MALLHEYYHLTLENTLANFWLLLLQLFLFLCLFLLSKIVFCYGCKFLCRKKSWLDLTWLTKCNWHFLHFSNDIFKFFLIFSVKRNLENSAISSNFKHMTRIWSNFNKTKITQPPTETWIFQLLCRNRDCDKTAKLNNIYIC